MIDPAVRVDARQARLSRFFAIYFVASILVPTMAPFRTVSFADLVRASILPSARIMPSGISARDTALAAPSPRQLNRRLKTRLKVIADIDQLAGQPIPSRAAGNHAPNAGVTAHRKPPPILRI